MSLKYESEAIFWPWAFQRAAGPLETIKVRILNVGLLDLYQTRGAVGHAPAEILLFFFFFTLVTGPRRSLSLKLSETKVYDP